MSVCLCVYIYVISLSLSLYIYIYIYIYICVYIMSMYICLHPQRWWSKETTKNKQRMVSEEIQHFEESKCLTIAVVQPKQGA